MELVTHFNVYRKFHGEVGMETKHTHTYVFIFIFIYLCPGYHGFAASSREALTFSVDAGLEREGFWSVVVAGNGTQALPIS